MTSEIQTIHLQLGVTFLIKPNNQNLFFSQPVAASFPVQRKTCGGMGGGGGGGGGMERLREVFDMLQYFETILSLVESI